MNRSSEPLSAPPRFLLWLVVVIFFLLVVGVLAGMSYFGGGQRLGSLIPFVVIGVLGVVIAVIGGAVIYRRSLPRLLWLWLTLIALVVIVAGAFGSILLYQNVLPPRYQEQVLTEVPIFRVFLPPTPEGGLLPTVAPREGGISPDDLLSGAGAAVTPLAPTVVPTLEPSAAPVIESTQEAALEVVQAPSPTPTDIPATAAPQPTSAPVSTTAPTQPAAQTQLVSRAISRPSTTRMYGFTPIKQGWNDCGPANITMALSHFGWRETQDYAANLLKPNTEDKNVSPSEMVNFVREQTYVRAITRIGGDMELLKDFIAANIPIIIETGYTPEGELWFGHYQTVVGYDDNQSIFYVYDSYLGTGDNQDGLTENYASFDAGWQAFNRVFIAIYEPERESIVQELLGDRADVTLDAQHALEVALQEARTDPQNGFAWFNVGSSYTKLGQYQQAVAAYDRARQLDLPYRMLWYQFGPFEAYFGAGYYDDVMALVNSNISTAGNYVEETFYWQGRVLQAQGRASEAAAAYQRALAQNPRYDAARDALSAL